MEEVWRIVPTFPSYEVSSFGRVRRAKSGRLRVLATDHDGYQHLTLSENAKHTTRKVHHLVAAAFLGPKPSATHCLAHNDGNPANNRPDNLRWATQKENLADRKAHGTLLFGERQVHAKLTSETVREIRRLNSEGRSYVLLASDYRVSKATIAAAVTGRCWGHVK